MKQHKYKNLQDFGLSKVPDSKLLELANIDISKLKVKIGQLKDEIDELNSLLQEQKELNILYNNPRGDKASIKSLRANNANLKAKIIELEKQLVILNET